MTQADVCLILEGTYPYVTGGVSTWAHELLLAQRDLSFHLVTLLPRDAPASPRYEVPNNVVAQTIIRIQVLPQGAGSRRDRVALIQKLGRPLVAFQSRGGLKELKELIRLLAPHRRFLGRALLMNSTHAWKMLLDMYNRSVPASSFLDYFWTWRSLIGGLFSILLADLPEAALYHSVSTGYAGLLLARAVLETGRPGILTEHGIYTNERRIEMAMANWLHDAAGQDLQIDKPKTLKDLWVDTFIAYSHACYEASSQIITLYEGNQQFQLQDGASQHKLRVIPNGIDYSHYSAIQHDETRPVPTVALIGRVVPIKDVKTFIRACAILRGIVPDFEALIIGPTDEDEAYYNECRNMVHHVNMADHITFTGRVKLEEYLGRIDLIVLTSISEAQPLVVLEAGAVGIPSVTTDVGSCRELIFGNHSENPNLGQGGDVTALCNPSATAHALAKLLTDQIWYKQCSAAIKERTRLYYDKATVDRTYGELYAHYLAAETLAVLDVATK